MADLTITQVETYFDPNVTGAASALSDLEDATTVRLSSNAAADYFVHFDGGLLAGSTFLDIAARMQTIARDMEDDPFAAQLTLGDEAFGVDVYIELVMPVPDGPMVEQVTRVDQAFLSEHGGVFASGAPQVYAANGDYSYANVMSLLGPTPVLWVTREDGSMYEIDIARVALSVDDQQPASYRRTFPRDDSLAGGAGRNFPPSKSLQQSNRTSGGYL